ncbi:MAG: TonB-dependent receptor [Flavobacteriales bacterium]|nr:TonB-dependent receptor [Flavobacteriales bacterium]
MRKKAVTYSLYGQIMDDKGKGLPYVSVGIFNSNDSNYVKGAATEPNGRFSVQIPAGNYYAKISFLSFEDKTINNIIVVSRDVDLKKIKLKPSVNNLEEFVVVEEKRLMELDLDKRVFNVSKDLTSQGADATEILDNVPSVEVDVDGNISLRGSGNVRVLINGKPSGMMGMTTADVLKQMDATQIEKIEVITNPSARYDAEGEVGIINIILKKDRREGVNGSVNANVGFPNNYGGGFNVTFKQKHFNVFTGYGVSFRNSPGSNISSQEFNYPDTAFSYNSDSKTQRFSFNNNFRLGTEIFINNYNSLTISGRYSFGDGDNETNLVYSDFDAFGEAVQVVKRDEIEDKDRNSYEVSMNYRKTFKKKDQLLTFDISKSQRTDDESSIITQTNSSVASQNIEQRVFNDEGGDNWLFQTDYVHPIKNGKIEFGLKHTIKHIDDDYAVEQFNNAINDWEFIPGFKNLVLYDENVSASYLMFGKKIKKFSYQIGVRAEYTDVKTELVTTNDVNKRDYLNFFPSTHFSYKLKKDNSIQLGYSRRIRRPHHYWLLPFFSFTDSRSNVSGNPNINPEYTDSYELGHLKNWSKASLLSSIYYRYTTSTMDWVVLSDAEGITRRMPVNLGVKDAFGVEFSGSYEFAKWWTVRGSYNFFREIRDGEFQGVEYDVDTYVWSTRINSKWKIKKKISLQASGNYRAPKQSPQGETKARYSLDLAFSFDVLKGNGTVSFTGKDVFNSRNRNSISFGENFVSESKRQWRSRYVRVSFTYRINQKKKRGADRIYQDGGSEG